MTRGCIRDLIPRPGLRHTAERGSQLVEASVMMLPFFALVLLIFDSAWGVFVKATLEHAVREGVRYAVTGQTSGGFGQVASISSVVQNEAMGLLSSQAGTIQVKFLDPTTLQPTNSNMGGNLVQVSIVNYKLRPLAPLLRRNNPVSITVQAGDMIEGSPSGIPPSP